jgi:ribonuclease P protein component
MRQGLRVSSPHFVLHCCPTISRPAPASGNSIGTSRTSSNRIGALLPKRWAKKAVRRNLLRRKIYAIAASHLPALSQAAGLALDCVVRLRASWAVQAYPSASSPKLRQELGQELNTLFAQAQRKIASHGHGVFAPATLPSKTA